MPGRPPPGRCPGFPLGCAPPTRAWGRSARVPSDQWPWGCRCGQRSSPACWWCPGQWRLRTALPYMAPFLTVESQLLGGGRENDRHHRGDEAGDGSANQWPDHGNPRVRPVATALALDGEDQMCDPRAEVTRRVDGVPGGATEGDADAEDEEGDGQRAKACGRAAEGEDDEHQYERSDDLGDQVPDVGADVRTGGEDGKLQRRIELLIEVLLVGQPADDRTQEGTSQLATEIGDGRAEINGNAGDEVLFAVHDQAEGDGWIEVGT